MCLTALPNWDSYGLSPISCVQLSWLRFIIHQNLRQQRHLVSAIEKNNADAFSPAAHQYFSTLPNWQATALLISSNMLQMNSSPSKGATLHIFHHRPSVYFWLASPYPHTSLSSPNFWNSYQLVEILAPKPDGKHTLYRKRGSGGNLSKRDIIYKSNWIILREKRKNECTASQRGVGY